jgi:hypothetical protein
VSEQKQDAVAVLITDKQLRNAAGGVDPSYINGVIGGFGAMTHHMEQWAPQPEEKRS